MTHARGSICTSVLYAPDVRRAATFYTALMGWTAVDVPGSPNTHLQLQSQGKTVANVQQSARAHGWIPHISVDNLDTTIAAATTLGGILIEQGDVSGVARLATIRDLEGARFGLWQPTPDEGVQVTDVVGSLWWVEVLSDDPPRARQFYSTLFGWQTRETAFEPFATYVVFERDGRQEAGVLPIGRDWDVTPHWNSIFAVDDCDALMRHTCELGGSAGFVHTVPKHGRVGGIVDPDGTMFWVRGPVPSQS